MVNSNLFVLDRPQNRRKFKSNDIDHNFQVFEIKESDIGYSLAFLRLSHYLKPRCQWHICAILRYSRFYALVHTFMDLVMFLIIKLHTTFPTFEDQLYSSPGLHYISLLL